jgi:hypothetical protein
MNFHVLYVWMSAPFVFMMPEPNRWQMMHEYLGIDKHQLIPNIPGC